MSENVLLLNLSAPKAKEILCEVAADSSRVFFTVHAERQMRVRGISRTQVLRCLRHGHITEGPARDVHRKWTFTIEVFSAGEALVVAAALDNDGSGNHAIVITAYHS